MTNSSNECAVNSVLQPTDNPRVSLVTCLLKEDNYSTWRRAIENALLAKNKMGFVDGSLPRPEANSPDEAAWIKGNSMVISWLFNSLHFSLHDSVAFFDTAMELWKDLEERFSQGNAPSVDQQKMEIVNTQQRDQSWNLLQKKKRKVQQFLMGLHDKFNVVRSQILNIEPLPSLARVYGLVAQEERQQQLAASKGVTHWRGLLLQLQKEILNHPILDHQQVL
ncbi:hypothetical protein GH714_022309 [Hevea brasiliensis]|uniref:Retrotransposon Copia-like N-terminal domain-containing protein n=1 Tax=Hevea brasiliensis TaxID=3981 RepID=A0A6A6MV68_HEVBR|nr:hypothetical protein GH714_022309 [Hevea brasiliensis]